MIVEAELDVSFQIRALDEKETKDQLSTTIIGPKRFQTSKPGYFGVVLMVKKGRAVITRSRTEAANGTITTLPDKNCWQGVQILRHGNQAINFASLDGRNTNTPSHPESLELPLPLPNQILANAATTPGPTSKFVEEWVQTTAETKCIQPFEPIKEPFKGEPLVEPLVESDSEEAVKGKDARASPMKRRHARNRKKPSAQDDAAIEDEDDASVAHLIEPRFTSSEEARSSRPTSYAHSVLHDSDSARATPQLIEIGVEETCQQANNCMVQRAVMSINPNCELLSICDSHRSKPPDSRSATDRPRKPAVVGDLLTQEDSRVAYPVVFPAPAINAPYMPSTSSRASYASELPAGSSVPGWLNRNPTTTASTTRRKGLLLIDDEEAEPAAQPASYLAAAKRGAGRSRGQPPGRGIAHRRAYRGVDPPKEGLQPNSEVQSRKVHHTMNQKMAKPDIRQASQLEAFERATVQLLQSANTFRGKVKLEVDIGRILVKAGNGTIGRTFLSSDWSSIFSDRTGNRPETVFTHL